MVTLIQSSGHVVPSDLQISVDKIPRAGGTPLVVTRNGQAFGVIQVDRDIRRYPAIAEHHI